MSLFEIGRLVVKIAGRDAGKTGIVVDILEKNYVLVDGQTRRKKVNIKHLEPLPQIIKIKPGASNEEIKNEFEKIGLKVISTKPKKATERPKKEKTKKEKTDKEKKVTEKPKTENKEAIPKKEEKPSSFEEKVEKETNQE